MFPTNLNDVAVLPRAAIAAFTESFRVISTDGKAIYWQDAPYYTTDAHVSGSSYEVKVQLTWGGETAPGSLYREHSNHAICIYTDPDSGSYEHICIKRFSSSPGIWFNGGTWSSGAYYSGSGWVR